MKKSPLGFASFILALVLWVGVLSIKIASHLLVINHEKSIAGALFEMISGSMLLLIPLILILAIVALFKEHFVIKSYSSLAIAMVVVVITFMFIT
jgi:hypothetical protein